MSPAAHHNDTDKQQIVAVREEESFDLRKIVYTVLAKWPFYIISIIFFMALGTLYYLHQKPAYIAGASVLIDQAKATTGGDMWLLQGTGFPSMLRNNMDNEIGVFTSPDLIAKVLIDHKLYISSWWSDSFIRHTTILHTTERPFDLEYNDTIPSEITPGLLTITKSGGGYAMTVKTRRDEPVYSYKFGSGPFTFRIGKSLFTILRNDTIPFDGKTLKISVQNPLSVAATINSKDLNVVTSTETSTLLNLTLRTFDPVRGRAFLGWLIEAYNLDASEDKNATAVNTARFIDERLRDISAELGSLETQVEDYRKENKLTDIQVQSAAYLQRNEGYNLKQVELETQLNLLQYIRKFLAENDRALIPTMGTYDDGLQAMVLDYNTQLLQLKGLEDGASSANPVVAQLKSRLDALHANIISSVDNSIEATGIQLNDLKKQRVATDAQIGRIPTIDKEYTDILRQSEVKATLFSFLLQKREEANLTQAGISPKAKVIASPSVGDKPVAPRRGMIFALFLVLGLAVPSLVIWLVSYFRTKIESASDLEALRGVSIIGDVMKASESEIADNKMVVKPNDDAVINEMFRTMRNNLLFMLGEHENCVVLITSTVPKEGKTFVSINLARTLSLMDKKVVVIGADLRNPQIANSLNIPKREKGLSTWLAGMDDDVDGMIEQIARGFSIIQAGPIPPNPNELLSGKRFLDLLKELRQRFDYVVIDSAPTGSVSDTFTIAKHADATVYVVREHFSKKDTVNFINDLVADRRLHNVGLALNMTAMKSKTYGYGGTKYKYSYRYRYGYADKYSDKPTNKKD